MRHDNLKHLRENERAALEEFVARLREHYADQVVLVVLFGSKARGEADEESDPDVLVVVKNAEQFTLNELAKAQRFVARVEEHLSKRDLYAEQGV